MKTHAAVYAGSCTECGSRIHIGDPITRSPDDEGWSHVSCADEAPVQVCGRCFLTICDC